MASSDNTQNNNFKHLQYEVNPACRAGRLSLLVNTPAYQYITQKKIQNTVRVPASLYLSDLGALNAFQLPDARFKVNWNQMSDRRRAHVQPGSGYSQGSFYHGSSTRHTQTRPRPGACTPGGAGVDIKHNSYQRYLNRIKGGKLARPGPVLPTYGIKPIEFNPAFPIYGGKVTKPAITTSCGPCICPNTKINGVKCNNGKQRQIMYRHPPITDILRPATYEFKVGDKVYAKQDRYELYREGKIISVMNNTSLTTYNVELTDGQIYTNLVVGEVLPWFPCDNCFGEDNILFDVLTTNALEECQFFKNLYPNGYIEILNILRPILDEIDLNIYFNDVDNSIDHSQASVEPVYNEKNNILDIDNDANLETLIVTDDAVANN